MKVSRIFHKSAKGVSKKIEGCFKGVFNGSQKFQREFQVSLKCVSRVFQATLKFLGCFKKVSRVF